MNFYSFSKPGQRHRDQNQESQDQIFGIRGSDRISVCVSDGASFTPYGREAAQKVATLAARLFYDRFWPLMLAKPDAVRRELCAAILPELQRYAKEKNIPPEWMAATLLVLAMDEQGRYLCVHLGDGAILEQPRDTPDRFRMLSAPSNGVLPHSTYLTMNADLMAHLKFSRSLEAMPQKLLILTDGADELLRTDSCQRTLPCRFSGPAIEQYLDALHPQDDYSAVEISAY